MATVCNFNAAVCITVILVASLAAFPANPAKICFSENPFAKASLNIFCLAVNPVIDANAPVNLNAAKPANAIFIPATTGSNFKNPANTFPTEPATASSGYIICKIDSAIGTTASRTGAKACANFSTDFDILL